MPAIEARDGKGKRSRMAFARDLVTAASTSSTARGSPREYRSIDMAI